MKTKMVFASLLAVGALAFVAQPVLAKGGTPQNHHCMKDGAELAGKTKKQCKKEGGKWEKIAAAPAAAGAAGAAAPAAPAGK